MSLKKKKNSIITLLKVKLIQREQFFKPDCRVIYFANANFDPVRQDTVKVAINRSDCVADFRCFLLIGTTFYKIQYFVHTDYLWLAFEFWVIYV